MKISEFITCLECHDSDGIRLGFQQGIRPADLHDGLTLFDTLITMYTRGSGFKKCVRAFVDAGLKYDDKSLLAVWLDDADALELALTVEPGIIRHTYSYPCAFTPLYKVTLLHLCAEYNHTACGKVLLSRGADVNALAGTDENGFGGQTPIFHTVNQDARKSVDMMRLLLQYHADLRLTVKGLIWGKGFDWETFIPSVNPISYAMMGLLRQFQRSEADTYATVSELMIALHGTRYNPVNIPNRYLKS